MVSMWCGCRVAVKGVGIVVRSLSSVTVPRAPQVRSRMGLIPDTASLFFRVQFKINGFTIVLPENLHNLCFLGG